MKKKGFTLIELLIVIAIIGLLSTLAMVSMSSARAKARDAKRLSDLSQIRSGMELYFNDHGTYALKNKDGGDINVGDETTDTADTDYIKNWSDFVDPRAAKISGSKACSKDSTKACHYAWTVVPNVDTYEVCARMEMPNDKFPKGQKGGYMISITPDGFQEGCSS